MKVLIATDLYTPQVNGVVTSVLNLREELEKLGHDVKVLTLSQSDSSYVKENVYYVKSFPLKVYPDIRASILFENEVVDQLIDWDPDIVHTQCEFFTLFFAKTISRKVKCPLVHTYHTMYEYYIKYAIKYEYIGSKLLFGYLRKSLKKCDIIIVPTKKVEASIRSYELENEVKVIPTGIDLSKFKIEVSRENILKEKSNLGIDENKKIILTLGRIAEEKNIDELVLNIRSMLRRRDDFVFLIVGDGPYKAKLEKRVNSYKMGNSVIFTGMINPKDINLYYKMSDVFVSASQSETQGLTYVEAMANGLPQVCKYDDCLDGLLESGYNGFYFENKEEFIENVEKLLDDEELSKEMSINAQNTSKRYSKETFGKSVAKVYEEAIENYEERDRFKSAKEIINTIKDII